MSFGRAAAVFMERYYKGSFSRFAVRPPVTIAAIPSDYDRQLIRLRPSIVFWRRVVTLRGNARLVVTLSRADSPAKIETCGRFQPSSFRPMRLPPACESFG
jgi:hypothetical protein